MYARIVMTSSGALLVIWGLVLIFLPREVLEYINLFSFKPLQLLLTVIGAFYFSFGLLNWLYRKSPVGGIYNRPVVVANLSHFFIAGMAVVKGMLTGNYLPPATWLLGAAYLLYALAFGFLLFQAPFSNTNS